jgi:hypothetical protein
MATGITDRFWSPIESVTVKDTGNVPGVVNSATGSAPDAEGPPAPKLHTKVYGGTPPSPLPANDTSALPGEHVAGRVLSTLASAVRIGTVPWTPVTVTSKCKDARSELGSVTETLRV